MGVSVLRSADARPWRVPYEPSVGTAVVADRLDASCLHPRAAAVGFLVGAVRGPSTGVAAPVVCHSDLRIDLVLRPFACRDPRSQPFLSASFPRQQERSRLEVIQSAGSMLLRDRARGSML